MISIAYWSCPQKMPAMCWFVTAFPRRALALAKVRDDNFNLRPPPKKKAEIHEHAVGQVHHTSPRETSGHEFHFHLVPN
jgi:hypothetical protein